MIKKLNKFYSILLLYLILQFKLLKLISGHIRPTNNLNQCLLVVFIIILNAPISKPDLIPLCNGLQKQVFLSFNSSEDYNIDFMEDSIFSRNCLCRTYGYNTVEKVMVFDLLITDELCFRTRENVETPTTKYITVYQTDKGYSTTITILETDTTGGSYINENGGINNIADYTAISILTSLLLIVSLSSMLLIKKKNATIKDLNFELGNELSQTLAGGSMDWAKIVNDDTNVTWVPVSLNDITINLVPTDGTCAFHAINFYLPIKMEIDDFCKNYGYVSSKNVVNAIRKLKLKVSVIVCRDIEKDRNVLRSYHLNSKDRYNNIIYFIDGHCYPAVAKYEVVSSIKRSIVKISGQKMFKLFYNDVPCNYFKYNKPETVIYKCVDSPKLKCNNDNCDLSDKKITINVQLNLITVHPGMSNETFYIKIGGVIIEGSLDKTIKECIEDNKSIKVNLNVKSRIGKLLKKDDLDSFYKLVKKYSVLHYYGSETILQAEPNDNIFFYCLNCLKLNVVYKLQCYGSTEFNRFIDLDSMVITNHCNIKPINLQCPMFVYSKHIVKNGCECCGVEMELFDLNVCKSCIEYCYKSPTRAFCSVKECCSVHKEPNSMVKIGGVLKCLTCHRTLFNTEKDKEFNKYNMGNLELKKYFDSMWSGINTGLDPRLNISMFANKKIEYDNFCLCVENNLPYRLTVNNKTFEHCGESYSQVNENQIFKQLIKMAKNMKICTKCDQFEHEGFCIKTKLNNNFDCYFKSILLAAKCTESDLMQRFNNLLCKYTGNTFLELNDFNDMPLQLVALTLNSYNLNTIFYGLFNATYDFKEGNSAVFEVSLNNKTIHLRFFQILEDSFSQSFVSFDGVVIDAIESLKMNNVNLSCKNCNDKFKTDNPLIKGDFFRFNQAIESNSVKNHECNKFVKAYHCTRGRKPQIQSFDLHNIYFHTSLDQYNRKIKGESRTEWERFGNPDGVILEFKFRLNDLSIEKYKFDAGNNDIYKMPFNKLDFNIISGAFIKLRNNIFKPININTGIDIFNRSLNENILKTQEEFDLEKSKRNLEQLKLIELLKKEKEERDVKIKESELQHISEIKNNIDKNRFKTVSVSSISQGSIQPIEEGEINQDGKKNRQSFEDNNQTGDESVGGANTDVLISTDTNESIATFPLEKETCKKNHGKCIKCGINFGYVKLIITNHNLAEFNRSECKQDCIELTEECLRTVEINDFEKAILSTVKFLRKNRPLPYCSECGSFELLEHKHFKIDVPHYQSMCGFNAIYAILNSLNKPINWSLISQNTSYDALQRGYLLEDILNILYYHKVTTIIFSSTMYSISFNKNSKYMFYIRLEHFHYNVMYFNEQIGHYTEYLPRPEHNNLYDLALKRGAEGDQLSKPLFNFSNLSNFEFEALKMSLLENLRSNPYNRDSKFEVAEIMGRFNALNYTLPDEKQEIISLLSKYLRRNGFCDNIRCFNDLFTKDCQHLQEDISCICIEKHNIECVCNIAKCKNCRNRINETVICDHNEFCSLVKHVRCKHGFDVCELHCDLDVHDNFEIYNCERHSYGLTRASSKYTINKNGTKCIISNSYEHPVVFENLSSKYVLEGVININYHCNTHSEIMTGMAEFYRVLFNHGGIDYSSYICNSIKCYKKEKELFKCNIKIDNGIALKIGNCDNYSNSETCNYCLNKIKILIGDSLDSEGFYHFDRNTLMFSNGHLFISKLHDCNQCLIGGNLMYSIHHSRHDNSFSSFILGDRTNHCHYEQISIRTMSEFRYLIKYILNFGDTMQFVSDYDDKFIITISKDAKIIPKGFIVKNIVSYLGNYVRLRVIFDLDIDPSEIYIQGMFESIMFQEDKVKPEKLGVLINCSAKFDKFATLTVELKRQYLEFFGVDFKVEEYEQNVTKSTYLHHDGTICTNMEPTINYLHTIKYTNKKSNINNETLVANILYYISKNIHKTTCNLCDCGSKVETVTLLKNRFTPEIDIVLCQYCISSLKAGIHEFSLGELNKNLESLFKKPALHELHVCYKNGCRNCTEPNDDFCDLSYDCHECELLHYDDDTKCHAPKELLKWHILSTSETFNTELMNSFLSKSIIKSDKCYFCEEIGGSYYKFVFGDTECENFMVCNYCLKPLKKCCEELEKVDTVKEKSFFNFYCRRQNYCSCGENCEEGVGISIRKSVLTGNIHSNSCYYKAIKSFLKNCLNVEVTWNSIRKFHDGLQKDAHEFLGSLSLPTTVGYYNVFECKCGIKTIKIEYDLVCYNNSWFDECEVEFDCRCGAVYQNKKCWTFSKEKMNIVYYTDYGYDTKTKTLKLKTRKRTPKSPNFVSYSGDGSFGHYEYNIDIGLCVLEHLPTPQIPSFEELSLTHNKKFLYDYKSVKFSKSLGSIVFNNSVIHLEQPLYIHSNEMLFKVRVRLLEDIRKLKNDLKNKFINSVKKIIFKLRVDKTIRIFKMTNLMSKILKKTSKFHLYKCNICNLPKIGICLHCNCIMHGQSWCIECFKRNNHIIHLCDVLGCSLCNLSINDKHENNRFCSHCFKIEQELIEDLKTPSTNKLSMGDDWTNVPKNNESLEHNKEIHNNEIPQPEENIDWSDDLPKNDSFFEEDNNIEESRSGSSEESGTKYYKITPLEMLEDPDEPYVIFLNKNSLCVKVGDEIGNINYQEWIYQCKFEIVDNFEQNKGIGEAFCNFAFNEGYDLLDHDVFEEYGLDGPPEEEDDTFYYYLKGCFVKIKKIISQDYCNGIYFTKDNNEFLKSPSKLTGIICTDSDYSNFFLLDVNESDWVEEEVSFTTSDSAVFENTYINSMTSLSLSLRIISPDLPRISLIEIIRLKNFKTKYVIYNEDSILFTEQSEESMLKFFKSNTVKSFKMPPYSWSDLVDLPLDENEMSLEFAKTLVETEEPYLYIKGVGYNYSTISMGVEDENGRFYALDTNGTNILTYELDGKIEKSNVLLDSIEFDPSEVIKFGQTLWASQSKLSFKKFESKAFYMRSELANMRKDGIDRRLPSKEDTKIYTDKVLSGSLTGPRKVKFISLLKIEDDYHYIIKPVKIVEKAPLLDLKLNFIVLKAGESKTDIIRYQKLCFECEFSVSNKFENNVGIAYNMVLLAQSLNIEIMEHDDYEEYGSEGYVSENISIISQSEFNESEHDIPTQNDKKTTVEDGSESDFSLISGEGSNKSFKNNENDEGQDKNKDHSKKDDGSVLDETEELKIETIELLDLNSLCDLICKYYCLNERKNKDYMDKATFITYIRDKLNDYECPCPDEESDDDEGSVHDDKNEETWERLRTADYGPESMIGVPLEIPKLLDPIISAPIKVEFQAFESYHENLKHVDECCVAIEECNDIEGYYRVIASLLFESMVTFKIPCINNNYISFTNLLKLSVHQNVNISYQNEMVDLYFKLRHDIFASVVMNALGEEFTGSDFNIKDKYKINTIQTPDHIIESDSTIYVLEFSVTGSYERGIISKGEKGMVVKGKYDDLLKHLRSKTNKKVKYLPLVYGLDSPEEYINKIPKNLMKKPEILNSMAQFHDLFKDTIKFVKRAMPLSLEYHISKVKIEGKKYKNYLPINNKESKPFNFEFSSRPEHIKALTILKQKLKSLNQRLTKLNKETKYELIIDIGLRSLDIQESTEGLTPDAFDKLSKDKNHSAMLEKTILLKNKNTMNLVRSSKFNISISKTRLYDKEKNPTTRSSFMLHGGTIKNLINVSTDKKNLLESNYDEFLKQMEYKDPNDFTERIENSIVKLDNSVNLDTGVNVKNLIATKKINMEEVEKQLLRFCKKTNILNTFSDTSRIFRAKNPFVYPVANYHSGDFNEKYENNYPGFCSDLLQFLGSSPYTSEVLLRIINKTENQKNEKITEEKVAYMVKQKDLMLAHVKLRTEMNRLKISKMNDISKIDDQSLLSAFEDYNNLKDKLEKDYYRKINAVLDPGNFDTENPYLTKKKRKNETGFDIEMQGFNKNKEEVYSYREIESEMHGMMDYLTKNLEVKQCQLYDEDRNNPDGQTNSALKDDMLTNAEEIKNRVEKSRLASVCRFIQEFCYTLSYYSTNNVSSRHVMFDCLGYNNCLMLCRGGKLSQNKQSSKMFKLFYEIDPIVASFITSNYSEFSSFKINKIGEKCYCFTPWMELNNTLMMDGFSSVSKVLGGHVLTYLEQIDKKDIEQFMDSQAMRSILFLHNKRLTESTLHNLRYITMSLLGEYSGALEMLEGFGLRCIDKIQAYLCMSIENNYKDFYSCLEKIKDLGRHGTIKASYKSKFHIIDMFNSKNYYTNLQDFTEIIYYKYMMSKAPIVSLNEQISNAGPVLEAVKQWKLNHGQGDFYSILESTGVPLKDNLNDMYDDLWKSNHMYCPELVYNIGKFTGDMLKGVTNQSTITSKYNEIFNQTITTLASSKGMRTDKIDKDFFGSTGYEVVYDHVFEKADNEFYNLIEELLKLNVSDVKFGKAIDAKDMTRSNEIKKLIQENWGEVYFHVVPKIQWGGKREIYVMNYQSKLFTSTMESFYKYLCQFLPNEQISVPSNKRFKVIHQKIVENNELKDSKKYFITMDCRRWGPEANLTKYVMYMFGMREILPPEFLETFTFFFSKYFNKKYVFRSEVIDGLRNNEKYYEDGKFIYDFMDTEYEEERDIDYYYYNDKIVLQNSGLSKYLTEEDKEKMKTQYESQGKSSIYSDGKYYGYLNYDLKPVISNKWRFLKETVEYQNEFKLKLTIGYSKYKISNRKSSCESVTVPFGFVMGMFNYMSSMLHASSQLYFKYLIEKIYKNEVKFHPAAHSDDSGAKIECYRDSIARKVFYIYEIFQKACGHILSPKKTVFSRIYFEFVSILYIGSICLPASQKRLWQIKYNPSAEGYYKDAINSTSIQIDLLSNGCSHTTAYIASLIYQQLVDRFYAPLLKVIKGVRVGLPVELFGKMNELPMYSLLMGTQANSMRIVKYSDMERVVTFGYFLSNPFITDSNIGIFKAPKIVPVRQSDKIKKLIEKWENNLSEKYKDTWTMKNCKFDKAPLDGYWFYNTLKNPSFYASIMADSEIKRWRRSFTSVRHRKWKTAYGTVSDARTILELSTSLALAYQEYKSTGDVTLSINNLIVTRKDIVVIQEVINKNTKMYDTVLKNHEILYAECYKLDEAFNMNLLNMDSESALYSIKPVKLSLSALLMKMSLQGKPEHFTSMVVDRDLQRLILSQNRSDFVTNYKAFYTYLGNKVDFATPDEIYTLATLLTNKEYRSFYSYAMAPDTKGINSYNKYSSYLANNILTGKYYKSLDINLTIRSTQLTRHEMSSNMIHRSINTELCYLNSDLNENDKIMSFRADYRSTMANVFTESNTTWDNHCNYMTDITDFSLHLSKSYLYLMYMKKMGKDITNEDLKVSTYYYYEKEQKQLDNVFYDEGVIKGSNMGQKFQINVYDYDAVELDVTNTNNKYILSSTLFLINYILAEAGFNRIYQSTSPIDQDTDELKVGYSVDSDSVCINKLSKLFWYHDKINIVEDIDVISDGFMHFMDNSRINRLSVKGLESEIRMLPEIIIEKRYTPSEFSESDYVDKKVKIANNLINLYVNEKMFVDQPESSILYKSLYEYAKELEGDPMEELNNRVEKNKFILDNDEKFTIYKALSKFCSTPEGSKIDVVFGSAFHKRNEGFIKTNPTSINYTDPETRKKLAEMFYKDDMNSIKAKIVKAFTAFKNAEDTSQFKSLLEVYGLIPVQWALTLYDKDPIEKEIQLLLHDNGSIISTKFGAALHSGFLELATYLRRNENSNLFPKGYLDDAKLKLVDNNLSADILAYTDLKRNTLYRISKSDVEFGIFKAGFIKRYPEFSQMTIENIDDLIDISFFSGGISYYLDSKLSEYLESCKVLPAKLVLFGKWINMIERSSTQKMAFRNYDIHDYNTTQLRDVGALGEGSIIQPEFKKKPKNCYVEFTGFDTRFTDKIGKDDYSSAVNITIGSRIVKNLYTPFFKYMKHYYFSYTTSSATAVSRPNKAPMVFVTVYYNSEDERVHIEKSMGLAEIGGFYVPEIKTYNEASKRKYKIKETKKVEEEVVAKKPSEAMEYVQNKLISMGWSGESIQKWSSQIRLAFDKQSNYIPKKIERADKIKKQKVKDVERLKKYNLDMSTQIVRSKSNIVIYERGRLTEKNIRLINDEKKFIELTELKILENSSKIKLINDEINSFTKDIDRPWEEIVNEALNTINIKESIDDYLTENLSVNKMTDSLQTVLQNESFDVPIETVYTLGSKVLGFNNKIPWYRKMLRDTRLRSELKYFVDEELIDMITSGVSMLSVNTAVRVRNDISLRLDKCKETDNHKSIAILWLLSALINSMNFRSDVSDPILIENIDKIFVAVDKTLKITKHIPSKMLPMPIKAPEGYYNFK